MAVLGYVFLLLILTAMFPFGTQESMLLYLRHHHIYILTKSCTLEGPVDRLVFHFHLDKSKSIEEET